MKSISRREMLALTAGLGGMAMLQSFKLNNFKNKKFKIGACDWSLGKDSSIESFNVAKQIGLDGVQVNLGAEKNNMHLRQKTVQTDFMAAAKKSDIKISSLAIGELNNIPYKSDPRTEEWVWDSVDVAKNLGVKVVLLAFFNKNDLRNDQAGIDEVIRRLKKVAPKAEKAGVILGIESYLTAAQHLDIIQKVGSKSIKVYYDFRNATDAGNDIYKEIKLLGREPICEIHMKENGFLLGSGSLDWHKIQKSLEEINYTGDSWMQIEWAMPKDADVVESYKKNLQYLNQIFNKKA